MNTYCDRIRRGSIFLTTAIACLGFGPCGPIPGGALSGNEVDIAVADWSFANDVEHCLVEVRPESPRSMTVNCMSWQSRLFVSCSSCAGKRWSKIALAEPMARVKVGEALFPVRLERVVDPKELDAVWRARSTKIGEDEPEPRPEGWWTFELESR